MTIDTGNTKTYINESKSSGDSFWNSYYSQTYLTSKEKFVFKSKLDLMGNQIKTSSTNKVKKKSK